MPRMEQWGVVPRIAAATAMQAQTQGIARVIKTRERLREGALRKIKEARASIDALIKAGVIPIAPETH